MSHPVLVAPTAIAASQNYLIRAKMTALSNAPCADFESTVPLKVINRVVKAAPTVPPFSTPGPPPTLGRECGNQTHSRCLITAKRCQTTRLWIVLLLICAGTNTEGGFVSRDAL